MYRVESLPISIPIGRQGENHAMKIEIDCSSFLAEWPQATITAMLRRSVAENPYILVTSIDSSGILTWEPTAHDTGIEGDGQIEIRAVENDVLAKSVTAIVCVERSLTPPEPDTPIDWVENIKSDIAQSVTNAANSASDAAKSAASAQESAAAAAGSASAAQSSATAAAGSASAASKSATSAAASADAASGSASAAAQSAAEADTSAKASAASAAEAAGTLDSVKASADAAAASARAAAESASEAAGSKSSAAQAAADAAQAAAAAAGSASQSAAATGAAQAAAAIASAAASDAAGSAAAAAGSKDAAAQSASAAAASAEAAEKAAQDAAGIIDDTVIAEDKAWSSKQITDQNYTHFTVSGNPAVCEDVLEGYPLELSASWEPKQDGSGTPSPDNVRPITGGRDNVKITVNGTEHTLALPDTIYSGEVDAATREGEKRWQYIQLNGTENIGNYRENENTATYFGFGIYGIAPGANAKRNAISNIFVNGTASSEGYYPNSMTVHNQSSNIYIRTEIPGVTSVATLKSYLAAKYAAGTPVQICYELATPETFVATGGGRIDALAGTNTISTDADALTVGGVKPLRKPIDDTRVGTDNVWSAKHMADMLLPMQTVTGNPAVIKALEGYPLELSASWEPEQEGSGTPSPDNVRPIAGADVVTLRKSSKNLLNPADVNDTIFTPYGLKIELVDENTVRLKGTYETTGGSFGIMQLNTKLLSGRGLTITDTVTNGTHLAHRLYGLRTRNETAIALATDENDWTPDTAVDMTIKVGVYAPEAVPAEYQPYAGEQSSLALPRTIYGGIIDVATGQGQETWGYIASYAGEALPGEWISDRDEYAAGATPTVGAQVAYKLATPVPFAATGGQTVLALAGINAIITDADTLTVTAPTPPQTTASAAEAQAAKLDYVAMMADVDMDDLLAVDDAGADSDMDIDMPTGIEGSETDGKQEI